jgi:leader peptidase (prepilin peptidase) / N-methyltransferase
MSLELLTTYGWQGAVLFIWIALSVGSFLNVVIYRLPVMLEREWADQAKAILDIEPPPEAEAEKFNLAVPRSRCPQCGHQITALENIPIISWLVLRGRCSGCKTPISFRYPAIELLTALCSVVVILTFGFSVFGLMACLYTWMLLALTFIDYDTKLLPDQITYPLLWLGLIANGFFPGIVSLQDAVIGAIAGYLFLWSTYWGFKLITGKEGMGYGDFKLLAALGAWLGWQALPSIILIAAAVGLLYALLRIVTARQSSSEPIPFGPFLAVAGWVTLIFRDSVLGVFIP